LVLASTAGGRLLAATGTAPNPVPDWLDTAGPAAARIATLWWVLFALGGAIFLGVLVLLAVAVRRRRDQPLAEDRLSGEALAGEGNLLVLGGGVVLPVLVIGVLTVLMVTTAASVRAHGADEDPLVIEVTGWKFWWDVVYPDAGVRTANEIVVPVGQPVEFRVTSGDVIHSFWVPQLAGKIDMNPGLVNELRAEASEPGIYTGLCTEYCGIQHARMHFTVRAVEPDEFERWLADRAAPPTEPGDGLARQGLEVFVEAECIRCHTVDGVSPFNDLGPDLTDFGDRYTIGAGVMANNRGNLGGWLIDPQNRKPGNRMPPANLDGEELQALIAYLESLSPSGDLTLGGRP
jgi:cytochrome c oxidase subunit II